MHWLFHSRFRRDATLLIIDGFFFGNTDPTRISPILLIPALLLLAATLYEVIDGSLRTLRRYGGFGRTGRHRLTLTLTLCITGLLTLQSVRELSTRDVLIALPLAALAYLYVSYGRARAVP